MRQAAALGQNVSKYLRLPERKKRRKEISSLEPETAGGRETGGARLGRAGLEPGVQTKPGVPWAVSKATKSTGPENWSLVLGVRRLRMVLVVVLFIYIYIYYASPLPHTQNLPFCLWPNSPQIPVNSANRSLFVFLFACFFGGTGYIYIYR